MAETSREEMEDHLQRIATLLPSDVASLAPAQLTFALVWQLEAEINNGGFALYFENSGGRHAPRAPNALRAIGATAAAELVDRSLALFGPDTVWSNDVVRQAALADIDEAKLDSLDGAFYAYPDDLTQKLYVYATDHADELSS